LLATELKEIGLEDALELRPNREETYDISEGLKFDSPVPNEEALDKTLKATLQYYNNSLINNSLYLK